MFLPLPLRVFIGLLASLHAVLYFIEYIELHSASPVQCLQTLCTVHAYIPDPLISLVQACQGCSAGMGVCIFFLLFMKAAGLKTFAVSSEGAAQAPRMGEHTAAFWTESAAMLL